jgi:hypothetical protein
MIIKNRNIMFSLDQVTMWSYTILLYDRNNDSPLDRHSHTVNYRHCIRIHRDIADSMLFVVTRR